MPVKVFLVDDHDIVRQGIVALLENENSIQIIGEASNGSEALDAINKLKPDVVIMDINLPGANGIEYTRKIKSAFPQVKVLALAMHDHESYLLDMLEAGASGYILKDTSREELVFAITKVGNDGMYIDPEFTISILKKYKSGGVTKAQTKLKTNITEREMDVLKLIAQGLTNIEMAQKLFTSVRTIETRRKNLLVKTGTTNTATLIKFAVQNGIIE